MQPETAGTAPAFRRDHPCGALAVAHIRKPSNIYDLVEHAAARHGIPRLQLWQQVAKALTDRKLRIQNDLSEVLGPHPHVQPTLAQWLVGFRAAVDRYNDPNRGMARILKHIIVTNADFESWLRKANKRRGPQLGTTGYCDADRKMFPQIRRLVRDGTARSPHGAALMLADQGKLAGTGKRESLAKRVAGCYLREGK